MKKALIYAIAAICILTIACSKKQIEKTYPGIVNILTRKWAFSNMSSATPYYIWRYADINPDTIIFNGNEYTFLDKNNDTLEAGAYTTGHGKSINEMGHIQEYDSILFKMIKNSSLTEVALPPTYTLYYQLNLSNISLSFSNKYKDSTTSQGSVSYLPSH